MWVLWTECEGQRLVPDGGLAVLTDLEKARLRELVARLKGRVLAVELGVGLVDWVQREGDGSWYRPCCTDGS